MTLHEHSDLQTPPSIASASDLVRVDQAEARVLFDQPPEKVFNAFAGWREYQQWKSELQGPAHWLSIRKGGVGSLFVLYDKPGLRHLVHFGQVTAVDPGRYFAWRAPFCEWQRAWLCAEVEFITTSTGGTAVHEQMFFEAREDHLPILRGFLDTPGFDRETLSRFLEARLNGLKDLLDEGRLGPEDLTDPFERTETTAADWAGRISTGDWVRVLYADGEFDFDSPQELVFNAFTRFARYRDWTSAIHVGAEWLRIENGGVGSRFLLWEKPGDRQVMHDAVVTELVKNHKFSWRAPFAEWGKVFIGTSLTLEPRNDGGTHAYHVLYADLPEDYLPVFGGFGALHGFDLQFETFHIFEEARGFNRLLQAGAFSGDERAYLFDHDKVQALDWPLQEGRPWPEAAFHLRPARVIAYEDLMVELSKILSDIVPSPEFMRSYRDLRRTWRFHRLDGKVAGHSGPGDTAS